MERTVKRQTDSTRPVFVILGAGYTASALITPLIARGFDVVVTKRNADEFDALAALGARPLIYNTDPSNALLEALSCASHILSSIPQSAQGDAFLRALPKAPRSAMPKVQWAGYLSATSVYGDYGGDWVTEDEPLRPVTQRGKNRAEAEMDWLESGLPVHIFRLAGIYGPGRAPFDKLRRGQARAVIKAGHIVNRIHLADILNALLLSLDAPDPLAIYNVADDCPAPPQDVLDFAADLLATAPAKRVSIDSPEVSDMARSFYAETKRISNAAIKSKLGWQPAYPDYKSGLMAIYKSLRGQPESVLLCGHIDVPTKDLVEVATALPAHVNASLQAPGCQQFHIRQNPNLPTRFFVSEIFETLDAYAAHQSRNKNSDWARATRNCVRHYTYVGV